ncbi:CBS domain-containing protein [Salinibius halmophilus]|uniref:CBS domain-containing protein n=1 Tax=Salinibius halmophilus TaxID=1853216 RepID=UPI000E661473|nr:CBS domain-containing protein [Salinibius halmophilus]
MKALKDITVRHFMRNTTVAAHPQTTLSEAAKLLLKHGLTGCAVVDDSGKVVGFISEQDFLKQLISAGYHGEGEATVGELMRTDPLTVSPNDNVVDLAEQMTGPKPKIYPVVEGGKLLGEIARHDLLRAFLDARGK